jgi:hypothetical protein
MTNNLLSDTIKPIDVVIAWVDGDDPALVEKRKRYLGHQAETSISSGAHSTRFASADEIRYCLLSIMRFAPFVRNIFIVTDGQDPDLYDVIKANFPERVDSLKIVDHKEIFRGFEEALPTFNSISIGNMVWRIEGLSERFVYFNDDTFLIREINPEEWFRGNSPVLRGRWTPAPHLRVIWDKIRTTIKRDLLGNKDFQPRASFHIGQWNSARLLGFRYRYFTNSHTPHTVGKKVVEDFFENNKPVFEKNIAFRFRNYSQFTFISLSNHLQLLARNRSIANPALAYLKPYSRGAGYIDKKIELCEKDQTIKYLCVQSLDMCSREDQKRILGWMERLLEIEIPNDTK